MSQVKEGSVEVCLICTHAKVYHNQSGIGDCYYNGGNSNNRCGCSGLKLYPVKNDGLKQLEEDRKKIYGDPYLSHQAIGLVFEGIFRNRYHLMGDVGGIPVGTMFPADLVAEMLAGFKVCRLARPIYHKDSGDDAKVYVDFSQRFREGKS